MRSRIIEKRKERERFPSAGSLPKGYNGQSWSDQKPGSRSLFLIFHLGEGPRDLSQPLLLFQATAGIDGAVGAGPFTLPAGKVLETASRLPSARVHLLTLPEGSSPLTLRLGGSGHGSGDQEPVTHSGKHADSPAPSSHHCAALATVGMRGALSRWELSLHLSMCLANYIF